MSAGLRWLIAGLFCLCHCWPALAEGQVCIDDRQDDDPHQQVSAFYISNTQPASGLGGVVTFVPDDRTPGSLEQGIPGVTNVGQAVTSAIQEWKAACPNARNIPAFAADNSRLRNENGQDFNLQRTTAGVWYKPRGSREEFLRAVQPDPNRPIDPNTRAAWVSSTGTLFLAGQCERGEVVLDCESRNGYNYINWGGSRSQQMLLHEIGHLLGNGHDRSNDNCAAFMGIMTIPVTTGLSIKPEHCAMADAKNCDPALVQQSQGEPPCPDRPQIAPHPCDPGNSLKVGPCGDDRIGELPNICEFIPTICRDGEQTPWWTESFDPPHWECTATSFDSCDDSGCGSTVTIRCTYTFGPSPEAAAFPQQTVGPSMFVGSVTQAAAEETAVPVAMTVRGWAASPHRVADMAFWLDGQPVTLANFSYGTFAPEGCAGVNDPNCPNVGFSGTLPTAGLAVGQHLLQAVAADARLFFPGASLVSIPFTLTNTCPDVAPPNATLTAPPAGATISGSALLTASASDNIGVTQVKFVIDGTVAGSDPTSPYSWTWNGPSYGAGTHTLQARAFDACGNSRTSAPVTVTVVMPPDIAVFQAFDGIEVPRGGFSTINDTTPGTATSRRFRIANLGGSPLALGNPSALISAPCLGLSEVPATPVAAGGESFFRVQLYCSTPGTYSGTVAIQSNDPDEASYGFTVSGNVLGTSPPPPAPDIAVYQDYDSIEVPQGGSSTINSTPVSLASSRRFRITNLGNAELAISNPSSLVSGTCLSLSELPVSPVPVGGNAYFRVRLYCATPGTYGGTVAIQSNDPNESPYSFTVTGIVTP